MSTRNPVFFSEPGGPGNVRGRLRVPWCLQWRGMGRRRNRRRERVRPGKHPGFRGGRHRGRRTGKPHFECGLPGPGNPCSLRA